MDKNHWIGLGVLSLLVLVGSFYISNSEKNYEVVPVVSRAITTPKKSVVTPGATNTFQSIFKQPGSHVCSFEQVDKLSRTSSSVYIADGKMRAEFRTVTADKTSTNIMLYNSGVLFVWDEGRTNGYKTQISSISQLPAVIPKDLVSSSVLGNGIYSVSWSCRDWIKNNALLSPPSYVTFN